MNELIIKKLMSGRYILTVIGGVVFAYMAVKKLLPPETSGVILTAVFMSYFNRQRNGEK